ncbi:MAG: N-6 DNA methylase [Verrucomicrobia bacterium]|nr:N-6 DNA methylase [Verrucomicrobiota bacterium]
MPANPDLLKQIEAALTAFGSRPLFDASVGLFAALGYESQRRMQLRSPDVAGFLGTFDRANTLNPERALLADWQSVEFLFQLTDAEVKSATHGTGELAFDSKGQFDDAQINSFLFLAVDLRPAAAREGERRGQHYTRTELAGATRAINRLFDMPVLLVFKHGDTVSLGIIHRRLSKRDATKDVLEKVTLIKDIAFADPIRAHVEILHDFALPQLVADFTVANFVALHAAWQKRLGSYALSNDFYREIADWYFWAHHQVADGAIRLPQHCDTEQEKSLFLIRLLTRVIFSWFLVEKRLIPTDLFREHRLKTLLKDFTSSRDPKKPDTAPTYYHAVLQNLFFGTLNMPADQRGFREKKKEGERYDPNFGVTNLWRYEADFRAPADWLKLAARVPFLNGGLFDCLDDKSGRKKENFILDGFSDNPKLACHLPNDLFFGPLREENLSKDYGEEDKRTARSKKAKVRGLIEILSRYKFTIEENTPLEEEIALDPELLGKVFENLLASYNDDTRTTARKALGAFYTPREIVSYMVDEALKSYLATQVPRCKAALDDLFSNKATLRDIKPDTRDALIAAIGKVKILDPACGSGAFPMGALHRLVDLLQKLDPNNESWKRDRLAEARRYRQLLESSNTGKEELASCDARIADIEKSFDTRYHALDFARKLYLIENSIYGVDIQPIATQIAKLRFFISLVVDQKVELTAANLGVRPLPNLETRLVAADTLIPIEKAESDLFSGEIDRLRAELAGIRHEHFNARSPAAKRKWRNADAAKRSEIAALLEREHAIPRDSARKLAAWDPYDQNAFAPFFDSEWMFGLPVGKVRIEGRSPATLLGNLALINEAGGQTELTASGPREIESGFDVVIGNPPYVRPHKLPAEYKEKLWAHSEVFEKKADLYSCFIEKGINLMKPGGRLAFIVSNGFLRLDSFEKLRRFLIGKTAIEIIIDFSEDVFQSAAVKTCILIAARDEGPKTSHSIRSAVFSRVQELMRPTLTSIPQRVFAEKYKGIFDLSSNPRVDAIKAQMERAGVRLGERFEIQFGLKTGDDDKFLSTSAATRNHKRLLRGENVGRYNVRFAGEYVWYVPDRMIAHRQTARPGTSDRFEQPKILVRDTGDGLMATFDGESFFVKDVLVVSDASKNVLVLKTLLGLLNSSSLKFYYETSFPTLHVQRDELASLPLPDGVVRTGSEPIACLVNVILFLNEFSVAASTDQSTRDPLMLAYWEQILNGLVYELYFREELHAAGLRLFDLVATANLPDVSKLAEKDRLSTLRKKFEEVYDIEHPLRAALFSLGNLETVRIIEGKE